MAEESKKDKVYSNVVVLQSADDPHVLVIPIKLERAWTVNPGIEPDVNVGVIPYPSWDKLRKFSRNIERVPFKVHFFFAVDPIDPKTGVVADPLKVDGDVVLQPHYIIDATAVKMAEVQTEGGDVTFRPIEYRLLIADRRQQFKSPRGGALFQGEVNKLPAQEVPAKAKGQSYVVDANGQGLLTRQQCVQRCIKAMGLDSLVDVPHALSDAIPPANLEWFGNHAPTELNNLLEEAGYAIALQATGKLKIVKVDADDAEPDVPAAQILKDVTIPGFDRRGKTVIVTSAPTPIIDNLELVGPSPDTFEFVIHDTNGLWEVIEKTQFFIKGLETPTDAMRNGCVNVDENAGAQVIYTGKLYSDPKYKEQVKNELFRCIRINRDKLGPRRLIRYAFEAGDPNAARAAIGRPVRDARVTGRIAFRDRDGLWHNNGSLTDGSVPVTSVLDYGRIICVPTPIGTIDQYAAIDLRDHFVAPKAGEVRLQASFELWEKKGEADGAETWGPVFFKAGFRQGADSLEKLNDDELKTAIADPETLVVCRPELTVFQQNGEAVNKTMVENLAASIAAQFLADSGADPRIVFGKGFVKSDLNGKISKIEYDQEALVTRFTCYGWRAPSGTLKVGMIRRDGRGGSKGRGGSRGTEQAYPTKDATGSARAAMGMSGEAQPTMPMTPEPYDPPVDRNVLVRIDSKREGKRGYWGVLITGRATADSDKVAGDLIADMKADGATCLIVNAAEPDGQTHFLPLGEHYLGRVIGSNKDGAIVEVDCLRCGQRDNVQIGKADTDDVAQNGAKSEDASYREIYFTILTRIASDANAVWGYFRTVRLACGRITDISAEQKKLIANLGDCPA